MRFASASEFALQRLVNSISELPRPERWGILEIKDKRRHSLTMLLLVCGKL